MTWSTDDQINATCSLARTALSAYSDAQVAAGGSAVTTYDDWRAEAQRQIFVRLRQRGIYPEMITRASDLQTVEINLALVLLYEAVGQWDGDKPDVYMRRAQHWRQSYERDIALASPIDNVRAPGASFEFERG
jgi:hypothetical protein